MKFNTIINILILTIFFTSLSYADSNGVWQYASDTRSGTFGSDEANFNSNYTFASPVYFSKYLRSLTNPNLYFINFDSLSTFNDLSSYTFTTNSATINGNLKVTATTGNAIFANSTNGDGIQTTTSASGKSAISAYIVGSGTYSGFFEGKFQVDSGDLIVRTGNVGIGVVSPTNKLEIVGTTKTTDLIISNKSCTSGEKLTTDASGKVVCGTDNVDDGVYNLATMKTAVSNDFHNLGGTDNVKDADYVIGNEVFEITASTGITKTGTKASGYTLSANCNAITGGAGLCDGIDNVGITLTDVINSCKICFRWGDSNRLQDKIICKNFNAGWADIRTGGNVDGNDNFGVKIVC